MRYYICNKKANEHGYHEVHTSRCPYLPPIELRKNVGAFITCKQAIHSLRSFQNNSCINFIGCNFCCAPCYSKHIIP